MIFPEKAIGRAESEHVRDINPRFAVSLMRQIERRMPRADIRLGYTLDEITGLPVNEETGMPDYPDNQVRLRYDATARQHAMVGRWAAKIQAKYQEQQEQATIQQTIQSGEAA